MRIKILFDKDSLDKKLRTGWGISFLIGGKILFDTGEKGEWLFANMRALGVELKEIEAVAISHDHWDHTGGLWPLLKERKGLAVYACPGFGKKFKNKVKKLKGKLIEAERITAIGRDIYITGEIPGSYRDEYLPEQAVVVKTINGLTVITGCAHPGILKIIQKVKTGFKGETVYFVLGGFHLMESDKQMIEITAGSLKNIGVIKAGPAHCSGDAAEDVFKRYYKEEFVAVKAGLEIEV